MRREARSRRRCVDLRCVSAFAFFAVCACAPRPEQEHIEFLAMGTTVSIDVVDAGPDRARQALLAARDEIQRLGNEWYPWGSGGELPRLNAALARGESAAVSAELANLLLRSQYLQQRSEGAFDPGLGHLIKLWGFDRAERDSAQPWPSEPQLEAWRIGHPTIGDLKIEDRRVSSTRADLQLDLGAIGKGYAVDLAVELLSRQGITRMLVNAGGNLRAVGRTTNGTHDRAWRVAVRDPRAAGAMAWLELQDDESLSTSGDYERFAMRDGTRFNHILDPRTGRSATHTMAVTVLASDATLADAASTAIFVAGPAAWRKTARDLGIRHVLRVDSDGSVAASREFAARLHSPSSETHQIEWQLVDL